MRKKTIGLWIFIFALIGISVLFYYKSIGNNSTEISIAEKSVFHFSTSNFDSKNIHKLHGEVEFYYDTLLTPNDFHRLAKPVPSGLIEIPGKWNDFKINSEKINGYGKGTYKFEINVPEKGWYGLKITEFKSAYSLWINGEYLGGAGVVSSNKQGMVPSRQRKEYYYLSATDHIEVILQVSNFHHYKGGATETILFGTAQNLINYKNKQIGVETFIFGLLFILFIYHLILYFYRKEDKSILYFSLLCFAMFLRLGFIGEKILLDIASFIPWDIAIRIEYISLYSIGIFAVLFARKLFPNEISRWLVKLISMISIGFIILVLFTSPTIFSYSPAWFIYIIGAAALYLLIMVFVALLRGREYSLSIFIGYFVFFIFSLNDLLNYNHIIDSAFLMPLGLLVVTFSQAYVLAKKMATAYSKIKILSDELTQHANKLESIVEKRTKVVLNQKEKIENQKNELQIRAEELKKSNEQLISLANFKKDMTSMMIHDLKTPLNNIIGFASLPDSFEKYKNIIHTSGWDMQNLIQNILDVEKYESSKMSLNLTRTGLHELVNKAYEIASFMVYNNQIQFTNLCSEDQFVSIDNELIIRVFSNLLSNATKYGNKDGLIEVSSKIIKLDGKEFCRVNIYNSGELIPLEKLDLVFNKYEQLQNVNEGIKYSTGIGLTFCRMAIEAHGGEIGAISSKEKGVNFWFTLPM